MDVHGHIVTPEWHIVTPEVQLQNLTGFSPIYWVVLLCILLFIVQQMSKMLRIYYFVFWKFQLFASPWPPVLFYPNIAHHNTNPLRISRQNLLYLLLSCKVSMMFLLLFLLIVLPLMQECTDSQFLPSSHPRICPFLRPVQARTHTIFCSITSLLNDLPCFSVIAYCALFIDFTTALLLLLLGNVSVNPRSAAGNISNGSVPTFPRSDKKSSPCQTLFTVILRISRESLRPSWQNSNDLQLPLVAGPHTIIQEWADMAVVLAT